MLTLDPPLEPYWLGWEGWSAHGGTSRLEIQSRNVKVCHIQGRSYAMPNVSLTPELEGFAERCVASGRYGNVSEVMRAALRLLADQEARRTAFTEMLERVEREADEKGWLTADQVDAELRKVIAQAKAARKKT